LAYWLQGVRLRPVARQIPRLRSAELTHLDSARARLRIALLSTLALVVFLAFVVFPPRQLSVLADGHQITVTSRQKDLDLLVGAAGLERNPGDVFIVGSGQVAIERAVPAVVEVDGRTLMWRTRSPTVGGLLAELGIDVSPYDTVLYNGLEVGLSDAVYPRPINTTSLAGYGIYAKTPGDVHGIILTVRRAVPLTVVEDGKPVRLHTSKATLAEVLSQAGIRLGPADEVSPSLETPVTAGMEVKVRHANAINLRVGGSTRVIYTHKQTLEEALLEAGLTFGPDDRTEPPLSAAVSNGMTARLVRVTGQTFVEREKVEHKTVFKPDDSLSGSQTRRVLGRDGVRAVEYKIVIEDGVEVSRSISREYFDPEPVDTVIYYSPSALKETGQTAANFSVSRTLHVYATWYNAASSGKPATHPSYGITASGVPVTKGIVAVDPSVIPLGTKLYIPGYGFAVAADTGGGIVGNTIDLGYPDGVPVDWRTGWVDIYVLEP